MTAPFMPLYIADFQADTVHLNGFEAGAYLLLLMAMWRSGGTLDNDDKKLARYAKLTPQQWLRIRDQVMEFFVADDSDGTKITQRRLRSEIQKYGVAVEKRTERASKGGKAKSLKNNKVALLEAETSTASEVLDPANQNQNQNHSRESISNDTLSLPGECAGFEDFADAYPEGRGGHSSRRAWDLAITEGAEPSQILAGLTKAKAQWRRDATAPKFIPLASNWLEKKAWLQFGPVTDTPKSVPEMSIRWDGPDAIREAVEIEFGKEFALSYLLMTARWNEPSTILTKTQYAADQLKRVTRLRSYKIEKEA